MLLCFGPDTFISFGNLSHNHLILSLAFSKIYFINYFFAICKALVHFMYNILWLQSSSPHFLFFITPCIIVLLTYTQFITYCLQPPALSLRCHCQFSISLFYNCAFNYSSLSEPHYLSSLDLILLISPMFSN